MRALERIERQQPCTHRGREAGVEHSVHIVRGPRRNLLLEVNVEFVDFGRPDLQYGPLTQFWCDMALQELAVVNAGCGARFLTSARCPRRGPLIDPG